MRRALCGMASLKKTSVASNGDSGVCFAQHKLDSTDRGFRVVSRGVVDDGVHSI